MLDNNCIYRYKFLSGKIFKQKGEKIETYENEDEKNNDKQIRVLGFVDQEERSTEMEGEGSGVG